MVENETDKIKFIDLEILDYINLQKLISEKDRENKKTTDYPSFTND